MHVWRWCGVALLVCLPCRMAVAQTSLPPIPAARSPQAAKTTLHDQFRSLSKIQALGNINTTDPELGPEERAKLTRREKARHWLVDHSWFLPLAAAGSKVTPAPENDTSGEVVKNFYGRDDSFNPADNVQLLHTFGNDKRRGLSADLVSLLFPGGWRVAVGSSVTAGSGTQGGGEQTPEQAVARLREGGDMFLTLAYPLVAMRRGPFSATAFFLPRVNFLFNGFAGTQTLTEATEPTNNIGVESYVQLRDLEEKGGAFIYTRWGRQHVSEKFKATAGLESANFAVFELAIGAQIGDVLRLSVQRFHAPPAAAGLSFENLQGWHLVLQLAPQVKKK